MWIRKSDAGLEGGHEEQFPRIVASEVALSFLLRFPLPQFKTKGSLFYPFSFIADPMQEDFFFPPKIRNIFWTGGGGCLHSESLKLWKKYNVYTRF